MRMSLMLAAAVAAALAAGGASAASVEVKDAVARVTVIPENRTDIKIDIIQANPRLPLEVRTFGGRTIVDGRLGHRVRECRGSGENVSVHVRGAGDVAWREMPQVVIHTPREVDIDVGEAVWGSVGRSASLKLGNAGCGDWTVGNVEGSLRISQAGSGDTRGRLGPRGEDPRGGLGRHRGGRHPRPAGDRHRRFRRRGAAASIAGSLEVHVAGSGDVKVAAGRATTVNVVVAGSGNVDFRGAADSVKARIAGSGDVRIREVKGPVSKTVMGSGGVTIGD